MSIDNSIIGSIVFTFGILTICYFDTMLYTGIAGKAYLELKEKNYDIIKTIFSIWFINILSLGLISILYRIFLIKILY